MNALLKSSTTYVENMHASKLIRKIQRAGSTNSSMKNESQRARYQIARRKLNYFSQKSAVWRPPAKTYAKKMSFQKKSLKNPTGHWRKATESMTSSHGPTNNLLKTSSNSLIKYLIYRVASSSCRIKTVPILLVTKLSCNAIASSMKEIVSSAR